LECSQRTIPRRPCTNSRSDTANGVAASVFAGCVASVCRADLTEEGHPIIVHSRKVGESILIADNIRITVIDIGFGRVRLGIETPSNVTVHRQEFAPLNEAQPPSVDDVLEPPEKFKLVIEVYANEQSDPQEAANRLVSLYEKLNEFSLLKYGRGLTVEEFEQFIRAGAPVGVKS
jgi:carbon storage regulator CsrA